MLLQYDKKYKTTFYLIFSAIEQKLYRTMGIMVGVSMIHGGPSPNFFSEELFHLLVGIEVKPKVDDIHNQDIKDQINKVKTTTRSR